MTFSLFPAHLFRIQISVRVAEADPRSEGEEGFCPFDDEEASWQLEDHDAFVLKRFPHQTLKSGKWRKGKKGPLDPNQAARPTMVEETTTDQSYWGEKGKQPWYQKGTGKPFNKSKDKTNHPGKDEKPKPLPWITMPRHKKPREAEPTVKVDASRSTVT